MFLRGDKEVIEELVAVAYLMVAHLLMVGLACTYTRIIKVTTVAMRAKASNDMRLLPVQVVMIGC